MTPSMLRPPCCSVAAYPAVADAALNQPTFSMRVGRAVVEARNVARDKPFVIQASLFLWKLEASC